jgi:hypothetical protein
MITPTIYRLALAGVFWVLAALHLFVPGVTIDATALVLVILGTAPWLSRILKSMELPGGGKIEFRELEDAAERVRLASVPRVTEASVEPTVGLDLGIDAVIVRSSDPALSLVGLRMEIEQRLRAIAKSHDLKGVENRSAGWLLRELRRKNVFPRDLASALGDLIDAGNRAAHGAEVPPEMADWAERNAPDILNALTDFLGD